MKVLEIVKEVGYTMYKVYSKVFDTVFDVLFGSFKSDSMTDMYCNEHYYITSGGVIMRNEQYFFYPKTYLSVGIYL
jgi:hypothetical protein